jgi:hypothetical protein
MEVDASASTTGVTDKVTVTVLHVAPALSSSAPRTEGVAVSGL